MFTFDTSMKLVVNFALLASLLSKKDFQYPWAEGGMGPSIILKVTMERNITRRL
jgi:hypothetical protein